MAEALRRLGFEVIQGMDLTKAQTDELIRTFAVALQKNPKAGLFFYAGHALQVEGRNYLVPIDAELASAASLEFEMVRLDLIQASMERISSANILIFDACRDNPLSRNLARAVSTRSITIGRGLAPSESGAGTLIAYATSPGSVAADGSGKHSPFTQALLKFLPQKGEDISSILIQVRNDVMAATEGRQIPWDHSSLSSRFYFIAPEPPAPKQPAPVAAIEPATQTPGRATSFDQSFELEFWNSVKESNNIDSLNAYLERFPDGWFLSLARIKIEELKRKSAALSVAKPPAIVLPEAEGDLIKKFQTALKKAGCYAGPIDGVWSESSQSAMEKYGRASGKPFSTLTATPANLGMMTPDDKLVCKPEREALPAVQPKKAPVGANDRQTAKTSTPRQAKPESPAKEQEVKPKTNKQDCLKCGTMGAAWKPFCFCD